MSTSPSQQAKPLRHSKVTHAIGHYLSNSRRLRKRLKDRQVQRNRRKQIKCTHSVKNEPHLPSLVEVHSSQDEKVEREDHKEPVFAAQKGLPVWVAQCKHIEEDIGTFSRPLSSVPLPPLIRDNLVRLGITQLFPVQAHVLPELLSRPHSEHPRDLAVCAPTGCGKTLAYVVPLVCALMNRVVRQVRGLVVVPSHELACQVCAVFQSVMIGTGLRVGVWSEDTVLWDTPTFPLASAVDVLVTTPGRLSEHLHSCPPVSSLRALCYLVLDEADKLLKPSSCQWLPQLKSVLLHRPVSEERHSLRDTLTSLSASPHELMLLQPSVSGSEHTESLLRIHSPVRKLLLSATMTFDPTLLAALELQRPLLFTVASARLSKNADSAFTLPQHLKEVVVRCALAEKPLMLVHLVQKEVDVGGRILCFTNSKESSHRLSLLLKESGLVTVDELTSSLSQGRRKEALARLRHGHTQVLVCTDQMARGMDVEGLSCVVNFDPPRHFRTYLHRVGRTARAGKGGVAYTLLAGNEVHSFKTMLRQSRGCGLEEESVSPDLLQPYRERYEHALNRLQSLST